MVKNLRLPRLSDLEWITWRSVSPIPRYHSRKPPWNTLFTNSFFCVHIFLLHLVHSTSVSLIWIRFLHYTLGWASWTGGLHTLPFLLIVLDCHQLGVFCLLHVFDMPLMYAVSGQIQEDMSSPMGCIPKVISILNIVSLKFLLILLAWKKSSQGYIPTLRDKINL